MKKEIIIGITALMFFAVLAGAVSAETGDMHGNGPSGSHGGMGIGIGSFNYSNGVAKGRFVDFDINPESGVITNYQVNGTTVFSGVSYSDSTTGKVMVRGASLMYFGLGEHIEPPANWSHNNTIFKSSWLMLHAHDNPAGILHIVEYGENTITYTLGNGITAEKTSNHTVSINGTVHGVLVFTGSASVTGKQVIINLGTNDFQFGNYTYRGGSVVFIRTSLWHFNEKLRQKIMNAIANGKVGGEIMIHGNREDFMNYTYGFHAQVMKEEQNMVKIQVQSESHMGKVVLIDINKTQMQYNSNHKITVKIDGNELKMTSETDVLAGGTEGKYAVVDNGNFVTVMVYVPHFSEHTVNVESQPSNSLVESVLSNSLFIGAIIAIIVIIAIVAAVIIKKR